MLTKVKTEDLHFSDEQWIAMLKSSEFIYELRSGMIQGSYYDRWICDGLYKYTRAKPADAYSSRMFTVCDVLLSPINGLCVSWDWCTHLDTYASEAELKILSTYKATPERFDIIPVIDLSNNFPRIDTFNLVSDIFGLQEE